MPTLQTDNTSLFPESSSLLLLFSRPCPMRATYLWLLSDSGDSEFGVREKDLELFSKKYNQQGHNILFNLICLLF